MPNFFYGSIVLEAMTFHLPELSYKTRTKLLHVDVMPLIMMMEIMQHTRRLSHCNSFRGLMILTHKHHYATFASHVPNRPGVKESSCIALPHRIFTDTTPATGG